MASSNPFYFGYYPGDRPLFKRPSGGRKFEDAPDFDLLDFGSFMYQLEKDANMPNWFLERIRKDFESSLKAQVRPNKDVTPEALELYGAEAIQDMPGAFGIEISLNPKDWLEDPGGQALKTAKDWFNKASDWDDFDARNREWLWEQVLSDHPEISGRMHEEAAEAIARRIDNGSTASAIGTPTNPLSLDNQGIQLPKTHIVPRMDPSGNPVLDARTGEPVYDSVDVGSNAYGAVKNNVVQFQRNSRNVLSREKSYDSVIESSAKALKADLLTAQSSYAAHNLDAKVFMTKLELHRNLKEVSEYAAGKKGIQAQLEKFLSTGNPADAPSLGSIGKIQQKITDAENFLQSLDATPEGAAIKRELGNSVIKPFQTYMDDLKSFVDTDSDVAAIANITGSLGGASPGALQFADLETRSIRARNRSATLGTQANRTGRGGLEGGDLFNRGIERRLLRNIEGTIRDPNTKAFEDAQTENYKKLRTIFRRLDQEREYAATEEFVRAFESKRLMNVYLWPRLKNRFEVYTPAYWSNKALSKVHHFGLTLNPDLVDDNGIALFSSKSRINNNTKMGRLLLKPFENKIDIKFNYGGSLFRGRFTGGSHLETAKTVGLWLNEGSLSPQAFQFLFQQNNFSLLLSNPAEMHKFYDRLIQLNGNRSLPIGSAEDLEKFVANFKKFKDWLSRNPDKFGVDPATVSDPAFAAELLKKLSDRAMNKDYINITNRYAGLLEKVTQRLNILQTAFLDTRVGKLVNTVFSSKQLIANRVADLFSRLASKLLGGAIAAGSGGILATIAPALGSVLKKVIYVVTIKSIDAVTGIAKAALTGDFSKLIESWDKTLAYTSKVFLYAVGIPIGCFMLVILVVGGMFVTAIPQVNPIASIGGGPGAGVTPPGQGGVPPGGGWDNFDDFRVCGYTSVPNVSNLDGCLFNGGYSVTLRSYEMGQDNIMRHGSNNYWNLPQVGSACAYAIPFSIPPYPLGPPPSQAPNNVCSGYSPASPIYGYASDVVPAGAANCATLFLPDMSAQGVETWQVGRSGSTGNGNWITATGLNSQQDQVVKLVMLHVGGTAYPGDNKAPGEAAAELYNWAGNQHVHLELSILEGGQWVAKKPEDYICR